MMKDTFAQLPVIIVGGGLSGLSSAAMLARAGYAVTVFEKASAPGGRAVTKQHGDFSFNLGAHALYLGGSGEKLLDELGVEYHGSSPALNKFLAFDAGNLHALPLGMLSLLKTTLLTTGAKIELLRFYITLKQVELGSIQNVSMHDWLEKHVKHVHNRQLILALTRLITYTNAPEMVPAGFVLGLLQAQVRYLDGGWQTLVNGLQQVAQEAGAKIVTHARVVAIDVSEERYILRLSDGTCYPAAAVVLAVDARAASTLVMNGAHKALHAWAEQSISASAACFDVALRRLPRPQHVFALGIDCPLYCSVQSTWARLAPEGSALIQTMKYLRPGEAEDPEASRKDLESLLDVLQPGWRAEVLEQYFLPHMIASNAIIQAGQGGLSGRPGPTVPGLRNLYVVGDWVGPEGQLADACFASARNATHMIMTTLAARSSDYAMAD